MAQVIKFAEEQYRDERVSHKYRARADVVREIRNGIPMPTPYERIRQPGTRLNAIMQLIEDGWPDWQIRRKYAIDIPTMRICHRLFDSYCK